MKFEMFYTDFKESLQRSSDRGICVDIDDTLSATNHYFAQRYCALFGSPDGQSLEETIEKYRYVENVPFWCNVIGRENIIKNFQSDEHLYNCPPISKARDILTQINLILPVKFYITGRPQRFYEVTSRWLKKENFPKRHIVMGLEKNLLDEMELSGSNEWKAKLLEFLYPEIIGIVEDNSEILNFLSFGYKGIIFLHSHKDLSVHHPSAVACKDWEDVRKEIERKRV